MIGVTAAGGRLGRATLAALAERDGGAPLVALVRRPDAFVPPDRGEPAVRAADYNREDQMARAFQGVETLILISAPFSLRSNALALHRNALTAARRAGVQRVLFTSVIGNGQELATAYGPMQQDNRDTEALLKDSGMDWLVCRNGLYLDLDLHHVQLAASTDGVYRNNAGTGRCGYISIAELAFAIARLALAPGRSGEVLNLTGPCLQQTELLAAVREALAIDVRYEAISAAANEARLLAHPMVARRGPAVARMLTGVFEAMRLGAFDVEPHYEQAAGRPVRPLIDQLKTLAAR